MILDNDGECEYKIRVSGTLLDGELVYCTKASDWIITIPKDLVMSGDDESRAEYVVGIYGNVDPAKRVTVTPAPSFEMTNTGNAEVKYNA